jgi:very-short-patch-repair endonuclease
MISTAIRRATARELRANTTLHERAFWRALKELPVFGTHFRRQAPIGPYVVDFFCPAVNLIIELDGGHHNDDEIAKRDRDRQMWLEQEGYRVVRFWNSEVTNELNAVLERIYAELHGSREAEALRLKHQRRPRSVAVTPPRPSRQGRVRKLFAVANVVICDKRMQDGSSPLRNPSIQSRGDGFRCQIRISVRPDSFIHLQ